MSDQSAAANQAEVLHNPDKVPIIYSDGVANLFRPPGVVKFYMIRYDPGLPPIPGIFEGSKFCQTTCAEVVMPAAAFMAMTLFFQQQLEDMVERNEVDAALYQQMKSAAG
jgi:hypothetical protein